MEFSYECKLTHSECRIQEIKPGAQTREIKYRGGTPSTHRLSSFKAPSAEGDRACTYTLVSLRNDGKETGRYSGTYFIPGS